jgi:hypothetical protein
MRRHYAQHFTRPAFKTAFAQSLPPLAQYLPGWHVRLIEPKHPDATEVWPSPAENVGLVQQTPRGPHRGSTSIARWFTCLLMAHRGSWLNAAALDKFTERSYLSAN